MMNDLNLSFKESDFSYLSELIHKESGVFITTDKEYLLKTRLSPLLKSHNFATINHLVQALQQDQHNLKKQVINAMMTHETFFFRDQKPFEVFQQSILPLVLQRNKESRHLRIWSIACSSGQECYSLAIILKEFFPELKHWNVKILGTDISEPILQRAQHGKYTYFETQRGLPPHLFQKYFHLVDGNHWQISSDLLKMVQFKHHNILEGNPEASKFDILFCRNVLIYFDAVTKEQVVKKLSTFLNPQGYLFLGGAETTLGMTTRFEAVEKMRNVYTLV